MAPEDTSPDPAAPRPDRGRRWCVPPALLRDPGETLEGSPVADEWRGAAGLALWQTVRDVALWAATAPAERPRLFHPDAAARRLGWLARARLEPELHDPLALLAGLGRDEDLGPAAVASACLRVAHRLEARATPRTAVAYAQAAALASPADPYAALAAGRTALRAGDVGRAGTWLRRGVAVARRAQAWDAFALAHGELGAAALRRGLPELARKHLVAALRACRRYGVRGLPRGDALAGLFRLARAAGDNAAARQWSHAALRAYGGHPAAQQEFTHQVAAWWLERGQPAYAAVLLRRAASLRGESAARLDTLSLLALAAAQAGAYETFGRAWTDAWTLLRELGDAPVPASVVERLYRGAELARAGGWRADGGARTEEVGA